MTGAPIAVASLPGLGGFVRSLAGYARAYRGQFAVIGLCVLVEMAFYASLPLAFKLLVDDVLVGRNRAPLFWLLGLLSAGVGTVALAGLARDYLAARVFAGMLGGLRARLFDHLQRLSLDYFGRTSAGETLNRFSGDVSAVESALTSAIPWAVLPGLDVVVSTILLFLLNGRLALLALLVFPLSLIGPRLITRRAADSSYRRKVEEGQTLSHIQENLSAQPVVKAFGLQDLARRVFEERNLALVRRSASLGFLNGLMERSASAGTHFLQVLLLGTGGYLAWRKQLSIGSLAAFQTLFLSLSYSLSYVIQYVPNLIQAAGAMRHINELLDELPGVGDAAGAPRLPRITSDLVLRDVTFAYGERQPSLERVSLAIPAGAAVALVGPSGSGKSTIINLLLRLYDPRSGAVLLDGTDVRGVTQESLRSQIGVVFQDSFLFNLTIRENIRLGRPGASDAEVEAAARAAEIHDLVTAWPAGYDTLVGERGERLSGGQRQRVAIARAMVRNPAILILDEATSALDPATETALNATFVRLRHGRTVLTVTHRLAAAADGDSIFVFEQGRLVEHGTHAHLLAQSGLYRRLWKKQTGFDLSQGSERVALTPEKVRELPFLQQLPPGLQAEAAAEFVSETVPSGRVVVRQGDPGDRFYLIVRGRVTVSRTGTDGLEGPLAVLEDGDFFGEISLLQNVARTATVRAEVQTVLLTLHRERFQQLLARAPGLEAAIQATVRKRQETAPAAGPSAACAGGS